LLGTRLLVGVGLISYSAYLWHYVLFSFARHRSLTEPSELIFLSLAILSFPLAYLSWRYVERPFRSKDTCNRKTIFTFTFVGSALFISIGLAGYVTNGWQGRIDEQLIEFLPEMNGDKQCVAKAFQPRDICELVDNQSKLTILVGDSHAGSIAHEMQKAFSEKRIGLLHIQKNACPPVQNVYRADGGNTTDLSCYKFNEEMYQVIKESRSIEYVIMMARWTLSMEGTRFDNQEGGVETSRDNPHLDIVVDDQPEYHPTYNHRPNISEQYSKSVQAFLNMGKKVILIYSVPEVGWNVPNYVSRYYLKSPNQAFHPDVGSTSYAVFKERNRRSHEALDNAGQHPNLFRVYPERILCDNDVIDRCIVQKDGRALYRDDNHLSNAGAKLIVDQIIGLIN
jgi:hypothetical protein